MANIYEERAEPLHQLLERAKNDDGATLLLPYLQRPYVWKPGQVALLVDSLIRGWPFGKLLLWKIGQGELRNIPSLCISDAVGVGVDEVGTAIQTRDDTTRAELIDFEKATKIRVDV